MNVEIERYVNGEMGEEETRNFEVRMSADPLLRAEVEENRELIQHLKNQHLREKLQSMLGPVSPEVDPGKKSWRWLLFILFPILILLIFFLIDQRAPELKPASKPPLEADQKATEPVPAEVPAEKDPAEEPALQKTSPRPERFTYQPSTGLPRTRGKADSEWLSSWLDSGWEVPFKEKIEDYGSRYQPVIHLILQRKVTDAYIQLKIMEEEAISDTLFFLEAYCFLQLQEGDEAQLRLNQIKSKTDWRPTRDWYEVMAHLLKGELDMVENKATHIQNNRSHKYSENARDLLSKIN